jgi:dCMP deaminase
MKKIRRFMKEDKIVGHKRLAWDEYFAAQALLISNRATCKRAKVGAVLVKDHKVVATGYNGSVSGTEHCLDHDCLMVEGHCVRTLHAEVNAILQGAERGIPKGFTAYVTHFPCLNCTKQLLQVGCKRVVYIHQYRIDEYAEYLYREKEVELVHLPLEVVKEAIAEADFI